MQGGFCWGSVTKKIIDFPDSTFDPFWSEKPEIAAACGAFLKCLCKRKCGARCTCMKAGISCAVFCACDGNCYKENVTTEDCEAIQT